MQLGSEEFLGALQTKSTAALIATRDRARDEAGKAEQGLKEAVAKINSLNTDVGRAAAKVDELARQVADAGRVRDEAVATVHRVEIQLAQAQGAADAIRRQIDPLRARANDLSNQARSLEDEIRNLRNRLPH